MRTLGFRLRQLTIAALLVAATIPAVANTAAADGNCFSAQFLAALPGYGAGTITTHECVTSGSITSGTFTTEGTFDITVAPLGTIATGELTASHHPDSVMAWFEGEIKTPTALEFEGTLQFTPSTGFGATTVTVDGVGTVTVHFQCSPTFVCVPVP